MNPYGQQPGPDNNYGYPPPPPQPPQHEPPRRGNSALLIAMGAGLIVLVIALTTWLVLAFDGAVESGAAPASASASAVPTQTMSLADQDATFYRWVLRHPWSENGNTQQNWTDLAGSMCGAFDRGAGYDDVATILVDEFDDFTTADARDFVREAVTVYCPEHLNRVE